MYRTYSFPFFDKKYKAETVNYFLKEKVFTVSNKKGKYEIIEKWREGGMGIVYKAKDPDLDRIVAIKTIKDKPMGESHFWKLRTRFGREARIGGGILKYHPNIATIYEYDKNVPFICMEFIEGNRLDELINKKMKEQENFSLEQTMNIMSQLLEVLDFTHQQKVIHRDINPNNIILTKEGTLKLIDFGIAKTEEEKEDLRRVGKWDYSSLEQLLGGKKVDHRTDIFSTGVILYELLSGKKAFPAPFRGMSDNITERQQTYIKEIRETIKLLNPSKINQQISYDFDWVVQKALQTKPKERFQTTQEFLDALLEAYLSWLCKIHYKQHHKPIFKLLKSGCGRHFTVEDLRRILFD
jgi:serine/threonine-protein kinase